MTEALNRDEVLEKVREHLSTELEVPPTRSPSRPASGRTSTPTRSTSTSS